jgi:hypothetical protein
MTNRNELKDTIRKAPSMVSATNLSQRGPTIKWTLRPTPAKIPTWSLMTSFITGNMNTRKLPLIWTNLNTKHVTCPQKGPWDQLDQSRPRTTILGTLIHITPLIHKNAAIIREWRVITSNKRAKTTREENLFWKNISIRKRQIQTWTLTKFMESI